MISKQKKYPKKLPRYSTERLRNENDKRVIREHEGQNASSNMSTKNS